MDIKTLKNYILENNLAIQIIESLGCSHIKLHSGSEDPYLTFSNPDGDNPSAVTLYLNESLSVINYTREISNNPNVSSDIFTLIEFYKEINFFQSLKYVCDLFGIDFYRDPDQDVPESLRIRKMLKEMELGKQDEDDNIPVKQIPEKILSYYRTYVNDFWANDNVPYDVQREWELGYDESTNRITIPIRNEIGELVGVKGRLFKENLEENDLKFLYMEPCSRNKILYGIYKTYDYIKQQGRVYCLEGEKGSHQLWSYGFKNVISFGGKKVGKRQIDNLSRLGVEIVLCMDQDVKKVEVEKLAGRFVDGIPIFAIYDEEKILKEKESPSDQEENFRYLIEHNIYQIK